MPKQAFRTYKWKTLAITMFPTDSSISQEGQKGTHQKTFAKYGNIEGPNMSKKFKRSICLGLGVKIYLLVTFPFFFPMKPPPSTTQAGANHA
jgi:hypothetical protein